MVGSPQVDGGNDGEGRDALCSVAVASQLESGGLEGMDLLRKAMELFGVRNPDFLMVKT